jgi:hypothetical protein
MFCHNSCAESRLIGAPNKDKTPVNRFLETPKDVYHAEKQILRVSEHGQDHGLRLS